MSKYNYGWTEIEMALESSGFSEKEVVRVHRCYFYDKVQSAEEMVSRYNKHTTMRNEIDHRKHEKGE